MSSIKLHFQSCANSYVIVLEFLSVELIQLVCVGKKTDQFSIIKSNPHKVRENKQNPLGNNKNGQVLSEREIAKTEVVSICNQSITECLLVPGLIYGAAGKINM